MERGRLDLPPDADPGVFILSDGKLNRKPTTEQGSTVRELITLYQKSLPKDSKAPTTLKTEETHVSHLLKHLRASKLAQSVTAADMQTYVERRLRDNYRDKPIRPDTVKKEVATFRLIWNWAVTQNYLTGPAPTKGLKYPKTEQKLPFKTREEIEKIIKRGGLTDQEERALWDSLVLTSKQVQEVLDYVKQVAEHPFIYPMFVFAAHTGARRSEILRSQVDDFDFQSSTVLIREKKRNHDKSLTYRRVQISDLLEQTMKEWFAQHPGGQFTICEPVKIIRGKTRRLAFRSLVQRPTTISSGLWPTASGPRFADSTSSGTRLPPTLPPPASISESSTSGWATKPKKCGNDTNISFPISSGRRLPRCLAERRSNQRASGSFLP